MRSKRALTWIMVVVMGLPQAVLWSAASAAGAREVRPGVRSDTDVHQALSDAALAAAWGGSIPTTKIGASGSVGFVEVLNPDQSCPPDYLSTQPILPANNGGSTPRCKQSIPRMQPFTDVSLILGGMAAMLYDDEAVMEVWVNRVRVPASLLGGEFFERCPRIPGSWGTAVVSGALTLTLYDCSEADPYNLAVVPYGYLYRHAFNVITVRYSLGIPAFDNWGSDIDTRIIWVD